MHLEMIGICGPSLPAPQPATPHPSSQDSKSRGENRVQGEKRPHLEVVVGSGRVREGQNKERGALHG